MALLRLALVLAFAVALADAAARESWHARRAFFTRTKTAKSVDDPLVVEAAQFAVEELQQVSDSGIYRTLQLERIHEAATEIADFHYAIHLRVALSSPYFESGNATEDYTMLVLEDKPDMASPSTPTSPVSTPHERSIAIDEFPVMDEDAIETFWIEMVETRRRQRKQLFEQWSREDARDETGASVAAAEDAAAELPTRRKPATSTAKKTKKISLADLQRLSSADLRRLLRKSSVSDELHQAITAILDARWDQLEQSEVALDAEESGASTVRDEL